ADADAVVNLAGAGIARRWTRAAKRLILDSRVRTTEAVVRALQRAGGPRVLVNASAVGYYGPRGDERVTEREGPGDDFLARVCRAWEAAAVEAERAGVRVVRLRTGFVVGRGGGLRLMALPFRLFVGGPLGSGRQWMPWIHIEDVVGMIRFALDRDDVSGPLNVSAPEPVRNRDFAWGLGGVLGRPSVFPAPALALRLVMGEAADMILTGQRAVPEAALAAGYRFRFTDPEAALRDVLGCRRKKARCVRTGPLSGVDGGRCGRHMPPPARLVTVSSYPSVFTAMTDSPRASMRPSLDNLLPVPARDMACAPSPSAKMGPREALFTLTSEPVANTARDDVPMALIIPWFDTSEFSALSTRAQTSRPVAEMRPVLSTTCPFP